MSTVELERKRLPLEPPAYEACTIDRDAYLSAYERIHFAECQATERVKGNPTDKTAQDDVISARVAGYLFIEFWNRRKALTDAPCLEIVRSLASPHQGGGDPRSTVFDIGKFYRDCFLQLCAFDPFHIPLVPQLPCSSRPHQGILNTLHTPFPPFFRHNKGYDQTSHEG